MNGIRPTVGIEFDDKYTNAKNKLLDFIKALDELDDIQKAKLAQEFITSYSMAISFEQFVNYMKNGGREIKKTDQLSQSFNTKYFPNYC